MSTIGHFCSIASSFSPNFCQISSLKWGIKGWIIIVSFSITLDNYVKISVESEIARLGDSLNADTIKLKDGTTLEGKILEENPSTIKIEYNVTKSIKDIKSINRSEIKEITKVSVDVIAFNGI